MAIKTRLRKKLTKHHINYVINTIRGRGFSGEEKTVNVYPDAKITI